MLPIGGFFQLGYVTTDLQQALALYDRCFGVTEWLTFDTEGMNPASKYTSFVSLGWTGNVMVELIQPKDPLTPLYVDAMPKDGFGVNLHHLGYLIESQAEWEVAMAGLEEHQVPVAQKMSRPDSMDIVYADARKTLGHYVEYVWARGEGRKFLDSVPYNPPPATA